MPEYLKRAIMEYKELEDKIIKLRKMIVDMYRGKLPYALNNPIEISLMQYHDMVSYYNTLGIRLEMILGEEWQTIIQETTH